jgi:uncharacterized protein (TIGR03437 family)
MLCRAQGGSATPRITAVVDAGAYTANIAQGSVFVVKGTNMCASGTVYGTVPYSASPLNGVKITFTPVSGVAGADISIVYVWRGTISQLSAILPSTVAAGDYNVIVTNNGAASAAFKTTVVAHKFGIITVAGTGAGRAVVQNYISPTQYDLGRYTTGTLSGYTYSPSHPGQIIVIWGTGIGPITSADNIVPGAIDLRASLDVQVLIDGVAIKPDLYAGRAPTLPGADEIILTLPANVSTGCLLTLQVSVNGQLSNPTNISIAAGNDTACTAPGITTAQLARLDQGGDFKVGTLALAGGVDTSGNTSIRVDTAGAIFVSVNTGELTGVTPAPTTPVPNNSCVVTRQILTVTIPTTVLPEFSPCAGATLNGPNVSNATLSTATTLNARVNGVTVVNGGVLAAGSYTVTGAGGKDVGPFKTSITLSQPLVVTSTVPTTIPRSQDLTLSWTGGGTDAVIISGASSVAAPGSTAANPIVDSGTFTCMTTGDKRTFTIPASILGQLPAARGSITVSSNSQNISFTAPLTAGGNLDAGYFSTGFSSRFGSLTFQ